MSNKDDKKQPKLKPAKSYASVEKKIQKVTGQMQDIRPFISTTLVKGAQAPDAVQEPKIEEDMDIVIPVVQPSADLPEIPRAADMPEEMSGRSLGDIDSNDFQTYLEVSLNKVLDNRAKAEREAIEKKIREYEAEGKEFLTPENICLRAAGYIKVITEDYNLYREQKNAIAKEQAEVKATVAQQAQTASRLETVIGRIEDVQGVKAPRRPPFPSWACLTYLFWHWPMYGFARMWQSKYFRRFCFLIATFVIIIEFCFICLLGSENSTLKYNPKSMSPSATGRMLWTTLLPSTASIMWICSLRMWTSIVRR